jgi:hypothetical protein
MNPDSPEDNHEDDLRRRNSNLVALAAVVVLVLLAYWTFTALDHSRRFQRCLDEGRRNCVDYLGPAMRPLIAGSFATA